jgi:UDP-N-acetyl-D-galactosamine dehydrogenase
MAEKIAIIGLGYVGFPSPWRSRSAVRHVVGFDIDPRSVAELNRGHDRNHEVSEERRAQEANALKITTDPEDLKGARSSSWRCPRPSTRTTPRPHARS